MSELAKGWPVAGWILRLFIKLMKRLTGHGSYSAQIPDGISNRDRHLGQQSIQPLPNNSSPPSYSGGNTDQYPVAPPRQGHEDFGIVETDQLISDVIWDSGQSDFDLDLSLFPSHLGFLQGRTF